MYQSIESKEPEYVYMNLDFFVASSDVGLKIHSLASEIKAE